MPRRKVHVQAGVPVGVALAAFRSRKQPGTSIVLEAIGGAVGGWIGAIAPDRLEPATLGCNHRSFCHSWSTFVSGLLAMDIALTKWENYCRGKATEVCAKRLSLDPERTSDRALLWIQETVWRVAAGILAGFIGGYGSHLVLDSNTPKGLPLAV